MASSPKLSVSVSVVFKKGTRYRAFFKKLFRDHREGHITAREEEERRALEFVHKNLLPVAKVK
jgi:hypothetical protein